MSEKLPYEELEKRVLELEKKAGELEVIEEELRKYQFMVESAHDAIFFKDLDSRYLIANDKTIEALGLPREEVIGKNDYELMYDRKEAEENIHDDQIVFKSGKSTEILKYMTGAGGKKYWFQAIKVPHFDNDGKVLGLVGIARDITARKRAEDALQESEKKYRGLFDNAPVGLGITDEEGKIIAFNDAMIRPGRYSSEDISKIKNILELYYNPEQGNKIFATVRKQRFVDEEEVQFKRKDGNPYDALLTLIPLHINGKTHWQVMVQDISERKRMDEAMRESEEKLFRLKKMESLGLLAGGVAHDLNNVLSGIVSYPDLILMELPKDSKFRKPIETIQQSGQRAADIAQDLLTIARRVATAKEPWRLNDIVNEYLNSPDFKIIEHHHPAVKVKINLDKDLLNISCSHIHVRKVVMNLISNAAEAIKGNGNVTISTKNRYVDRPVRGYDDVKIGEYAVLSVSDDGSGISSDDLERIFEPFYTKKVMSRSGTGLGLAVVWNVMQDHKGYIDVRSDENGTEFDLYFPITRNEVPDKDFSITIEDYKGNGETILVVDDVESQRDISCDMLDNLGYKTKAVSSGEEAVEYLKENTVDLILLDMIMDPGINGREAYERIIKIHPKQKAIIVSGLAETDDVKEAQQLGAGQYLKKPFRLQKIGLAVKEELEK